MRKQTVVRWLICAFLTALFLSEAFATEYIYIIDKSGSMKNHIRKVIDAIDKDIEISMKGGKDAPFVQGDKIRIWAFDSEVRELRVEEFVRGRERKIQNSISKKLRRLRTGGMTDIAKPLIKALEQFSKEKDKVKLFLYTDGQDTVTKQNFDKILDLYDSHYKKDRRLAGVYLVQFGNLDTPEETKKTITMLGGAMRTETEIGDSREMGASGWKKWAENTLISLTPTNVHWSSGISKEILKLVPLKISVEPPTAGLSISLALESTQLPGGMSIDIGSDRLDTEGRQSITFIVKNAPVGTYSAVLKLSSAVTVEPQEIPVEIVVEPPKPETVRVQFQPETLSKVDMPADGAWHKISNFWLSLSYPQKSASTKIRFKISCPKGVDLRVLPGGDEAQSIPPNQIVMLSDVGNTAIFQAKQTADDVVGRDLQVDVSFAIEANQNVNVEGKATTSIPLRFVRPMKVTVLTRKLDLGSVPRGTRTIKRVIEFDITGDTEGASVRLVKKGQGLAGISISPTEILLKSGKMSTDVEFADFEDLEPGDFSGTFEIVRGRKAHQMVLSDAIVKVSGSIPKPVRLIVNIENNMVAGQPIILRARFEGGEKGQVVCEVTKPDARKSRTIQLFDDGSSVHGDRRANDGEYAQVLSDTKRLGGYELRFIGSGPASGVQDEILIAPVLFKLPAGPIARKNIVPSRLTEPLMLELEKVISDHMDDVALTCGVTEITNAKTGQRVAGVRLRESTLQNGSQTLHFEVVPAKHLKGRCEFSIPLVIGPVEGKKARVDIPVRLHCLSHTAWLIGMAVLCLLVVVALVLIWVTIIVPVAWGPHLGACSNVSIELEDGASVGMKMGCRRNRWKSLYKVFALSPRASFGEKTVSDIAVPDRHDGVDGYVYPQKDGTCKIEAVKSLSIGEENMGPGSTKVMMPDGIVVKAGNREIVINKHGQNGNEW